MPKQLPNVANISMELAAHPNRAADIFHPSYPKFFKQRRDARIFGYIEEQLIDARRQFGHQELEIIQSGAARNDFIKAVLSDLFP